jgi:hypothetical protein
MEPNVIPMPVPAPMQPLQEAAAPQYPQAVPSVPAAAEPVATGVESGSVDKIRDILFGSQMRDYDKRFARLEERLLKESAELREETRRRFDSLETYIRAEFGSLSDRVKNDAQRRDELNEAMSLHLHETAKSIERKLWQLDEQTAQAQRDLRQQLLNQSKELSDQIHRKSEDLAAELAREAGELRHDKTDRAALADLFTELALRLNNQFRLPGE